MFANDFTGAWRSAVLGGDITAQIPVGYPNVPGIPYGYGFGIHNLPQQAVQPAFGYLPGRIPQTFLPQGFPGAVAQQNPFLSPFIAQMPVVNPMIGNAPLGAVPVTYAYAATPYTIGAWGIPQGFPAAFWR